MKKRKRAFLVLLTFCVSLCNADTWTLIEGETMDLEFSDYNLRTENISFKLASGYLLPIRESQFIHSDRIRAIRLQNKGVSDYWYTDYDKARTENPGKQLLIIYRNNFELEKFELFYHKLFLREDFKQLLKDEGFIACVLETIPDQIGLIEYQIAGKDEWRIREIKSICQYGGPIVIIADLENEEKVYDLTFRTRIMFYQIGVFSENPFLDPPESPYFTAIKKIDQNIRKFRMP